MADMYTQKYLIRKARKDLYLCHSFQVASTQAAHAFLRDPEGWFRSDRFESSADVNQ